MKKEIFEKNLFKLKNYFNLILFFFLFLIINDCENPFKSIQENIEEKLLTLNLGQSSDFERPKVLTIAPYLNQRDVATDTTISILFSKPMDKINTENAISVTANGGNANFRYNWVNDYTFQLIPKNGLSVGKKYEVRLNKNTARDIYGNFPAIDYLSNFYTIGATSPPYVKTSNPANTGGIVYGWPVNQNITVEFSEPMDSTKASDAASISGGAAVYIKTWNSDYTVLTFQLLSDLQRSTTYTLNVSTSATNTTGIAIDEAYSAIFFTGDQSTVPDVSITSTPYGTTWPGLSASPAVNAVTGVSKNDYFQFTFTKPMDKTSTEEAISFTPPINGNFTWLSDSLLTFTPTSAMTQESTYRLSVFDSAVDTQGLPLLNSYLVDFTVDNASDSQNITITGLKGYSVNASCIKTQDTNIDVPTTPIDKTKAYKITVSSTGCSLNEYVFEVTFTTAGGCALKTSGDGDIYEQASISYYSGGPGTGSPNVYYKFYNPPSFCSTAGSYQIGIKNIVQGVQYRFSLTGGSGGLKDINGNYLVENFSFIFYWP